MLAMYIDQIEESSSSLEQAGDFLLSPARLFFGHSYRLEGEVLKEEERFLTLRNGVARIGAIVLFPLSLISSFFGLLLKMGAYAIDPSLKKRFSFPILVNGRTEENFRGRLPPNPWSPNCVNSQEKSLWGKLYDADPIPVSPEWKNPIERMKGVLESKGGRLVEEKGNYLHYEFTVVVPAGLLKGTYTDDVDLFFDSANHQFQIRSASRKGFRDAVHLDFSQMGANKKRIEAIRDQVHQHGNLLKELKGGKLDIQPKSFFP